MNNSTKRGEIVALDAVFLLVVSLGMVCTLVLCVEHLFHM